MASRTGARNTSAIARHLLAAGLMLSTGYAFGLFTLGGCGGSQMGGASPADQQLPNSVMEKLTDCGKQGPKALTPVEYALVFTVAFTKDGQVQDVLLADSTLHVPEVEACMPCRCGDELSKAIWPLHRERVRSLGRPKWSKRSRLRRSSSSAI